MKKSIFTMAVLCLSASVVFGQNSSTILPDQTILKSAGTNIILDIRNTNASNNSRILDLHTNGSGPGLYITHSGSSFGAIYGIKTGSFGGAGIFQITNGANNVDALTVTTNGGGNTINGVQSGSVGSVANFNISGSSNSSPTIYASTAGTGFAIYGYGGTNAGGFFASSAGSALITGNGNVGIGTATPNEKLEVNGRLRLRRDVFTSGIWFNNSANGTALTDGAFLGLNNETSGSETIGFWLNGAFRFTVDRAGNTSQNAVTSSNLAGVGNRPVYANANGTLTTSVSDYYNVGAYELRLLNNPVGNAATLVSSSDYANISLNAAPNSERLGTMLHLPNGANITSLTLDCRDNSATKNLFCVIYSIPKVSGNTTTGTLLASAQSTGATNSFVSYTGIIPSLAVIDNQNNYYFLEINTLDYQTFANLTWDATLLIRGVSIGYSFQ